MSESYVYYELNWGSEMIRNNDNLMWRYWAAKEMAEAICIDAPIFFFFEKEEKYLTQILKKEWFR